MTDCSICGRPAVTQAFVEGALVDVCGNCVSHGREVKRRPAIPQQTITEKQVEAIEGFGDVLKKGIAASGKTVEELGKQLSINADYLKHIELGKRVPDEKTARRLEAALGIKLLKENQEEETAAAGEKPRGIAFTLGDFVQIKQFKK